MSKTSFSDKYSKKLEELKKHLDELNVLLLLDEGMIASTKIPDIQRILLELNQDNVLNDILSGINELKTEFGKQKELLSKIAASVFKMYQDDQINNEIFAKLKEYLEAYYPEPYQSGIS